MKNLFLTLLSCLLFSSAFSQINWDSLGFNYYALVRDSAGRVQVSKPVKLRFTILLGKNGTTANSPWIETDNATTDAYGFVDVIIGTGTKAGGTATKFSDVNFASINIWILIEVFNTTTQTYDILNKQALQAVPYAKVAGSVAGSGGVPPGTIVAFGGDEAHIPDGWLLCDGHELDNTDPKYQPLFNAIQYNWGTTNHANKFNLPYTLGLFLRGATHIQSYDPDATTRTAMQPGGNVGDNVGSYQGDSFKSHDHFQFIDETQYGSVATQYNNTSPVYVTNHGNSFNYYLLNSPTNGKRANIFPGSFSGGLESRPKNVYVNYIIKL